MSTNFVDLVRSSYAALAGGDLDLVAAHCDPEIEIVEPPDRPGAEVHHGHEGLIEALTRMDELPAPAAGEPERFIDAGHERVIVLTGSRVDLLTGRAGKCVRWEMFSKLDDAFAAIGLRKLKGET
jgi:ketosteroid isomerase-like protein